VRSNSLKLPVKVEGCLKSTKSTNFTRQKFILYGHGTWHFIPKDGHRLTTLNYKVLRETFGRKREMIIGGWKKLHNEELHTSHLSANIIKVITTRKMRSTGHVALVGQ
jgi:hypothetical protein